VQWLVCTKQVPLMHSPSLGALAPATAARHDCAFGSLAARKMLRKPALSPSSAGILYICAGAFCLTVNDALAKYLDDYLPVMEIIFFRMLFSLPLIIVF